MSEDMTMRLKSLIISGSLCWSAFDGEVIRKSGRYFGGPKLVS